MRFDEFGLGTHCILITAGSYYLLCMYKASQWCSLAVLWTKTAKNKDFFPFFSFSMSLMAGKKKKEREKKKRVKHAWSQSESLGSANLWQTQDQRPLLSPKAPSLEWRLTQLPNIIAFKAHFNLFISIIHSPELSKSSHQSFSFVNTEINRHYSWKWRVHEEYTLYTQNIYPRNNQIIMGLLYSILKCISSELSNLFAI